MLQKLIFGFLLSVVIREFDLLRLSYCSIPLMGSQNILKSGPLYIYHVQLLQFPSLCEKGFYSELFWSVVSRIRTEYGEKLRISPYSVRMRENADQNNSEYGQFLRSDSYSFAQQYNFCAIKCSNVFKEHLSVTVSVSNQEFARVQESFLKFISCSFK